MQIPAKTTIKPGELQMAIALINQLSSTFNIAKYKDNYTNTLLKLIKTKAKGRKIEAPHLRVVHSKAKDLLSQLKASLGDKKKKAS